jgi:hypothetical protein
MLPTTQDPGGRKPVEPNLAPAPRPKAQPEPRPWKAWFIAEQQSREFTNGGTPLHHLHGAQVVILARSPGDETREQLGSDACRLLLALLHEAEPIGQKAAAGVICAEFLFAIPQPDAHLAIVGLRPAPDRRCDLAALPPVA